ncbi:MAG TPA: enolase C-terminal domain-like protein [Alloacidobacterium sp.]|jgi:L-fuconate dehydratase|nr:enolase C-terminal domain-like protein [Alloacidobacterium sp.]
MQNITITGIQTKDARFPLEDGAGSDAVHSGAEYAFAVTQLQTDKGIQGTGICLTLGTGNQLVCEAIEYLSAHLRDLDIEELMSNFGVVSRSMADEPGMRWLGPHKGVVHLALASIVNACFDLWAKARQVPLWRLLLDLTPEQLVDLLDFHYLEDHLTREEALAIFRDHLATRARREGVLRTGYPGYDTSVGWFQYEDERIRENAKKALDSGFQAIKLKVGSKDGERDVRRANLLREIVGSQGTIMLDANQQWTLAEARKMCAALAPMNPYWVEEPTHPDDIQAHRELAREIVPMRIALGEHVPNLVLFKNFIEAKAVHFMQPDCTRLAGVSEFITASLLARKYGLPVVPHVGDMGQIHQHLVLFNHIAMGHEALFLEHIPHLRKHFCHPATVSNGVYQTPQEPGLSSDLREATAGGR